MYVTSSAVSKESIGAAPRPRRRETSAGRPATRPMRLQVARPGYRTVAVSVSGDVDAFAAPRLAELLTNRLRGRPDELVIDLSAVTFLGPTGLFVLAQAALRARITEVRLRIAPGQNRLVRSAIEVAGLRWKLPVAEDVAAPADQPPHATKRTADADASAVPGGPLRS